MPNKTIVLFMTHRHSASIAMRFERLARETANVLDCALLLHSESEGLTEKWRETCRELKFEGTIFHYSLSSLRNSLGYDFLRDQVLVPGSAHFPLLRFARENRYAHYWMIESDVDYRGNWLELLSSYMPSESDLIASHFCTYQNSRNWVWWKREFTGPEGRPIDLETAIKAFLPFYRISARSLSLLDDAHAVGWRGHFECLAPSILALNRHSLEDLSQRSARYLGNRQDFFGNLSDCSTIRWRPAVSSDEFNNRGQPSNLVFHPIKDNWYFDGTHVVHTPLVADREEGSALNVPAHPPTSVIDPGIRIRPSKKKEKITIPSEPLMPDACVEVLSDHLSECGTFLEYGCGGSTVHAAKLGVRQIISADTNKVWLNSVQRTVENLYPRTAFFPCLLDFGPTRAWGYPATVDYQAEYFKYPLSPWLLARRVAAKADLVLIDGRFRAASFLAFLLFAEPGVVALFDDYRDRGYYHFVERFCAPERLVDRMALFRRPDRAFDEELSAAFYRSISDVR